MPFSNQEPVSNLSVLYKNLVANLIHKEKNWSKNNQHLDLFKKDNARHYLTGLLDILAPNTFESSSEDIFQSLIKNGIVFTSDGITADNFSDFLDIIYKRIFRKILGGKITYMNRPDLIMLCNFNESLSNFFESSLEDLILRWANWIYFVASKNTSIKYYYVKDFSESFDNSQIVYSMVFLLSKMFNCFNLDLISNDKLFSTACDALPGLKCFEGCSLPFGNNEVSFLFTISVFNLTKAYLDTLSIPLYMLEDHIFPKITTEPLTKIVIDKEIEYIVNENEEKEPSKFMSENIALIKADLEQQYHDCIQSFISSYKKTFESQIENQLEIDKRLRSMTVAIVKKLRFMLEYANPKNQKTMIEKLEQLCEDSNSLEIMQWINSAIEVISESKNTTI